MPLTLSSPPTKKCKLNCTEKAVEIGMRKKGTLPVSFFLDAK